MFSARSALSTDQCRTTRTSTRVLAMARITAGFDTHRALFVFLAKGQVGWILQFYLFETVRENKRFCASKYKTADPSLILYSCEG